MPKVRDCMHDLSKGVDLVDPDDSIAEVVASVTRDPASRAVFVVNRQKKLVGIISPREILELLGARYLHDRASSIARELMATRARHIMGPPSWVSPGDDIEKGLKLAVQDELYDIPVVENDQVVGNLDCLEIIVGYQQEARKEAL